MRTIHKDDARTQAHHIAHHSTASQAPRSASNPDGYTVAGVQYRESGAQIGPIGTAMMAVGTKAVELKDRAVLAFRRSTPETVQEAPDPIARSHLRTSQRTEHALERVGASTD